MAVEMDLVLRQCLREFPHHHSVLLKQLVGTLAKVEPVRSLIANPVSLILLTSDLAIGWATHCSVHVHVCHCRRENVILSCPNPRSSVTFIQPFSPPEWLRVNEKRPVLLVD